MLCNLLIYFLLFLIISFLVISFATIFSLSSPPCCFFVLSVFCYTKLLSLISSCLLISAFFFVLWDRYKYISQIRSVAQSCPTLCDPMNHSTPGLPVHHQLPEFTQTHIHWVGDAIQPSISSTIVPFSSYPQSLPPSESYPMSQLFAWGGQSTGVSALASLLPKNT